MEKYICVHGHFYQPPRENPWLEAVEIQDSAYPYHDWNERITAECYAPNTASRILDGRDKIIDIVNNYARISFNIGPTLMSWMEEFAPDIYRSILDADRQSLELRSGHGNAVAQVYNHMIMPLAAGRDKRTQVIWGIRDFEHRFGRFPEGMWLAETAVDNETLDILAEQGIRFAVLAPHQAARVRKKGVGKWQDVGGARIDPSRAYLCRLDSGRSINLFFYDGPISNAVAFEKLLNRGEDFAHRLLGGFSDHRTWPQLLHIATDGETFGHHHKYGEMALTYALDYIEANGLAEITNYGEYLEKNPPTHEVRIFEDTSWSCCHGVERWRGDCGCRSGGHPDWNQEWRAPLRDALDWLRDELAPRYQRKAAEFLRDPWQARDDYVSVILDRSGESIDAFLVAHAVRELAEDERVNVLSLLEMQRHAMLMYTSCGWFFDEISGLETVQVIQYAGRCIQLAERYLDGNFEGAFLARLAAAKSNLVEHGDGAKIYEKFVKPSMIDPVKVGAHYAVSSIFEDYVEETEIFSYQVAREEFRTFRTKQTILGMGRIIVRSSITREMERISFCVLHFGNHDVYGGVRSYLGAEEYGTMVDEMAQAFTAGDLAEIFRLMDRHFGMHNYSIRNLFRDEQRKILKLILGKTLADIDSRYTSLYENSRDLMNILWDAAMPIPARILATAEIALNLELRNALAADPVDIGETGKIVAEIRDWNLQFDLVELEFLVRGKIGGMMERLRGEPENFELLAGIRQLLELAGEIPFELNCWEPQNIWFEMSKTTYPGLAAGEDVRWVAEFRKLGELLQLNTDSIV